MSKRDDNKV